MVRKYIPPAQTKLFALYFHELAWLCRGTINTCKAVFNLAPDPGSNYYLRVDPDLHVLIQSILVNSVRVKKLILTDPRRSNLEMYDAYNLRLERARAIQEILKDIDLEEILSNRIEHIVVEFDEDLDDANIKLSQNASVPTSMAAFNMTISHWEAFQPRLIPIRLYVSSERKIYSMSWSVDLTKVDTEVRAILQRLKDRKMYTEDGPGGLLIPI